MTDIETRLRRLGDEFRRTIGWLTYTFGDPVARAQRDAARRQGQRLCSAPHGPWRCPECGAQ